VKSPLLIVKKAPKKSLPIINKKWTKKALPLYKRELYKKSLTKCVELVLESPTTVYPL
jgi:hypothetical protein